MLWLQTIIFAHSKRLVKIEDPNPDPNQIAKTWQELVHINKNLGWIHGEKGVIKGSAIGGLRVPFSILTGETTERGQPKEGKVRVQTA